MTFFSRSVVLPLCFYAGTTEYKDECIVDKSKKPTEDGNYKDCTGEDHVKDGSTDCCNVDGVIDCCDKNASYVLIDIISQFSHQYKTRMGIFVLIYTEICVSVAQDRKA